MLNRIKINGSSLLIIYKLLNDVLFLLLIFFTAALIADGVLPGIVTNHISFLKIIIFIFLNLAAIYFIGNLSQVKLENNFKNKKAAIFLAVLAALLIFNSLFKLNIYLAVFILAVIVLTFYFLYKNFFSEK